jgi:hypothetical protein
MPGYDLVAQILPDSLVDRVLIRTSLLGIQGRPGDPGPGGAGTESVGGIDPVAGDVPLFTVPGGTVIVTSPEQHVPSGDDPTDPAYDWYPAIQAAIDAMAAQGFGFVLLQNSIYLVGTIVTTKPGVQLLGQRMHRDLLVQTGSTIAAGPSLTTGWVVQTLSGAYAGFGIAGMNVIGRGAGMTTSLGGILISDGTNNLTVQHVGVSGVSNSAIGSTGHPVACVIDNCILGMDSSHVTLTGPTGCLHLLGTDHETRTCEIARGFSDVGNLSGYKKVTYSGHWRCAVYVGCASSKFWDVVGEFGDCGWYVESASVAAGTNQYYGCRADFSAGHGWYLVSGAVDNRFIGCQVYSAGIYSQYGGASCTYNAVHHETGTKRNKWEGYDFYNPTGIPVARYGWADFSTGNSSRNANTLTGANIDQLNVVGDTTYCADGMVRQMHGVYSGPISSRPPSREHSYWYDTDKNVPSFSDGTWWRDIGGSIIGNLAHRGRATGQYGDNAIWWQQFGSSCTVAKGVYFLGTAPAKLLGRQNYAIITANSTAAAQGYLETSQKLSPSADFSDFPDVLPGHDYTLVVRTTAETTPRAVSLRCRWRDSSGTVITTDAAAVTGGGTNSNTALTTTYLQISASSVPQNAVKLDPIVRIGAAGSGMVAGEVFNVQDLSVYIGHGTDFTEP